MNVKFTMNTCELAYICSVIFLITIVVTKWRSPFSSRFTLSSHSAQVVLLLSLTADVYDFLALGMEPDIIDVVGVNSVMGKYINL